MKRVILSAAALALFAAPAVAQQSPQTSPSSSPSAQSSSPGAQPGQSGAGQQQKFSAQKFQQDLQKAGFKDVSVVDAAYLVHARTSDGNFALMLIDPPGSPSATTGAGSSAQGQAGQQAQSGQQHSQQQKMKDDLTKAGFSSVTVVDAAYLVHAKTADGSIVRMTINPPSMSGAATTGSGASGGMGSGASSGSTPSGSGGSQNR